MRIPLPVGGLFEAASYSEQPEGTTPDLQNVSVRDAASGRLRLCSRGGPAKFNTNTISGANAIRELVPLMRHASTVTYTVKSSISGTDVMWQNALPSNRHGISLAVDRQSNVFVACAESGGTTGINFIAKYNSAGTLVDKYPVALDETSQFIKSIKLDEFEDLYVAIVGTGGVSCNLRKYRQLVADTGAAQVWDIEAPNGGAWVDVAVRGGVMYALENTNTSSYLHRYDDPYGAAPVLLWSGVIALAASSEVAIAVDIAADGAAVCAVCNTTDPPAANGRVSKYGPMPPTGGPPVTAVWTITNNGAGQAVVSDGNGSIWSCGYGSGGTPKYVIKITDSGASAAVAWDWGTAEDANAVPTHFKGVNALAVDPQGVVFYTVSNTGSTSTLFRIKADGSGSDWSITTSVVNAEFYGVAVDPAQQDNDTKTEFVYCVTAPVATTNYAVHRLRVLTVATSDATPRSMTHLAVCNGNVVKFTRGAGAPSTPTGGASALQATARWTFGVSAFNRALFTDGKTYKSYDALTDTVSTWAATSAGQIPPNGRLLAVWNGRAVVSGFENDPHNWGMSAQGEFDDWDFFPPVISATQAVFGNSPGRSGLCPDIVTALIPYSDDLMIFGGDHTIQRLTGDPMSGGQFDLLTDRTGIVFGKAWAKDEKGVLYFFGQTGCVYAMLPGSPPEPISNGIDKRLRDVDVGANDIRLEWNDRELGLHVFITPYAGGATTHYFWMRDGGRWRKDVLPNGQNPTASAISDGDDPADRVLLLGGSDGYVRYWDYDANDDDGTARTEYAIVGPIQAGAGELESTIRNIRGVLDASSGTMDYSVHASDSPDYTGLGTAVFSSSLSAGRNNPNWNRARGQSLWIKIGRFVTPASGRFALESLDADIGTVGVVRNR